METNNRKLTLLDRALHLVFQAFFLVLSKVPRKTMGAVARRLARLWWKLDRRHRDITLDNLAAAYPEKDSQWVEQTAKKVFENLAIMALELPSCFAFTRESMDQYITVEGGERLKKAAHGGRGVLLLTAHFSNWEIMALATPIEADRPVYVMARPLDLAPMDRVIERMRARTGNILVSKDNAAETVKDLLKQKKVVGILLDQNAAWYEGVYVPFFGRIACTNKSMALFALRYKVPMVTAFCTRKPDGRYHVVYSEPFEAIRTGNLRDDIEATTAMLNQLMEDHIRTAPEQWLWVHRRWRLLPIPERARKKLKNLPPEVLEGAPVGE